MNTHPIDGHLTSKDVSRWLIEGPNAETEAHLTTCLSCQAKVADVKKPLTIFRSAVVAWSEEQRVDAPRISREPMNRNWRLLNWAPTAILAMTAMLLAGFLVGSGALHRHPIGTNTAKAPETVSDTLLMSQVDEEVSEAVPDAMAPLTELVAWDSDEGATSTAPASKPSAGKKVAAGSKSKSHPHVVK